MTASIDHLGLERCAPEVAAGPRRNRGNVRGRTVRSEHGGLTVETTVQRFQENRRAAQPPAANALILPDFAVPTLGFEPRTY